MTTKSDNVFCLIFLHYGMLCLYAMEAYVPKELPVLVIEPISSQEYGLVVVKKVQDTLNLTCSVFDNSTNMQSLYNISWSLPTSSYNSKNRVTIQSSVNSAALVILHLESRDEGEYTCIAHTINKDGNHHLLSKVVLLNIKNRTKSCGETLFACNLSRNLNCIPQRYKCDGHQDCEFGEDEEPDICGDFPCKSKLPCAFPVSGNSIIVRCIPQSWCCSMKRDANCTTKEPLSCCPVSNRNGYSDEISYYSTNQPHFTDVTFLQTTVYTVIGCAIVFMVVVTVLVIAICRVHMKRSMITTEYPPHPQPRQNTSLYDLDIYLNRNCMLDNLSSPGFFVTYNINNGVQFVGHAVDPPPYSEAICEPPKEGPPPPYCSHEALAESEVEALLQQPTTSQRQRIDGKQATSKDEEENSHPVSS